MKKFLVYLLAVVLVAAMGFSVFYLVRDNQMLSITTASLYKDEGDEFNIGLVTKKLKSYTKFSLSYSGDVDSIQEVSRNLTPSKGNITASLRAVDGGTVRVNFQTNNSKFRNLYCDILIGDGTPEHPFYINTAEQLFAIGRGYEEGEQYANYTADKYYELIGDINCAAINNGVWEPVDFNGHINGNGHTIRNIVLGTRADGSEGTQSHDLGIFKTISSKATIDNVVLDNVTITIGEEADYRAGALAAVNEGSVSRVNVKNVTIRSNNADAKIGGVVAVNGYIPTAEKPLVAGYTARLDRVCANLNVVNLDDSAVSGQFGGITCENLHGVVINSYSVGNAKLEGSASATFAGIVNVNKSTDSSFGANIKNCYSAVTMNFDETSLYDVRGIVRTNQTVNRNDVFRGVIPANQITGCYYLVTMTSGENINFVAQTYENAFVESALVASKAMLDLTNELDKEAVYRSTVASQYEYDEEHDEYKLVDIPGEYTYWDFEYTWGMINTVNNGLPYLTFSNYTVSDGFNSYDQKIEISSKQDLIDELTDAEDGHLATLFVIMEDIDMEGANWTPVGTIQHPFRGGIHFVAGKTISNFVATVKDVDEREGEVLASAFLGVTGSTADLLNVSLSGVTAGNNSTCAYAAAVVAFNGYVEETDSEDAISFVGSPMITNCTVTDSTIRATQYAAAVVAYNNGSVQGSTVNGNTKVELTPKAKLSYVGAIAAYNKKNITASSAEDSRVTEAKVNSVTGNTELKVIENSNNVSGCIVRMGGAAGQNNGLVDSVKVLLADEHGLMVSPVGNRYHFGYIIGGVVGTNYNGSNVKNCEVKMNIVVPRSRSGSVVGGVAGVVQGSLESFARDENGKLKVEQNYSIFACYVHDTTIAKDITGDGYCYVGGLAGNVVIQGMKVEAEYKEAGGWWIFKDPTVHPYQEYTVKENTAGVVATIVASFVENTSLEGVLVGGFASVLDNGIILDCGAYNVTLKTNVSDPANIGRCAGFVVALGEYSLVYRSYAYVVFADPMYSFTKYVSGVDGIGKTLAQSGWVQNCVVVADGGGSQRPDQNTTVTNYMGLNQLTTLAGEKNWTNNSWLAESYWTLSGAKRSYPVPTAVLTMIPDPTE